MVLTSCPKLKMRFDATAWRAWVRWKRLASVRDRSKGREAWLGMDMAISYLLLGSEAMLESVRKISALGVMAGEKGRKYTIGLGGTRAVAVRCSFLKASGSPGSRSCMCSTVSVIFSISFDASRPVSAEQELRTAARICPDAGSISYAQFLNTCMCDETLL